MRALTRVATLAALTVCVAAHAAPEWKVTARRNSQVVRAQAGDLTVRSYSVTSLGLSWGKRLPALSGVNIRIHLRVGRMYDINKLNELTDTLPPRGLSATASAKGGVFRAVHEGEAWGVKVTKEVAADAATGVVKMTLRLKAGDTGRRGRKYQFQLDPRCKRVGKPEGLAYVLPTSHGQQVLRMTDPCGQEVYDQDHYTAFPRTVRLGEGWALLASHPDRKGVLISGDNFEFAKPFYRYGRYRYLLTDLYGRDALLKRGDEHVETWTFRVAPGLGGLGRGPKATLSGAGALLTRSYVGDGGTAVRFTGPPGFTSSAEVLQHGRSLRRQTGGAEIELDLKGLPDGEYDVLKRVTTKAGAIEGREKLTLLRETWRQVDRRVARLRAAMDGLKEETAKDPTVARLRKELIRFKLRDVAAYKDRNEVRQVMGLLKDADRALKALLAREPAVMPKRGELIYANDLSRDTGDFLVYGNGKMTFSPKMGMYLAPVGTMNLWSKFRLSGSYMVEFDFYPLKSFKGGTMLQMCGDAVNPVSQYSLMCSASWGSMAYYMFGTKCYHFSFVRFAGRSKAPRICNLRKTGKGFYLLSEIADPITDTEKWYHLTFVKNGTRFLFFVDGKLVQEYIDIGAQGPILESGRLGIRNWSTFRSHMKNLRVHRPAK